MQRIDSLPTGVWSISEYIFGQLTLPSTPVFRALVQISSNMKKTRIWGILYFTGVLYKYYSDLLAVWNTAWRAHLQYKQYSVCISIFYQLFCDHPQTIFQSHPVADMASERNLTLLTPATPRHSGSILLGSREKRLPYVSLRSLTWSI